MTASPKTAAPAIATRRRTTTAAARRRGGRPPEPSTVTSGYGCTLVPVSGRTSLRSRGAGGVAGRHLGALRTLDGHAHGWSSAPASQERTAWLACVGGLGLVQRSGALRPERRQQQCLDAIGLVVRNPVGRVRQVRERRVGAQRLARLGERRQRVRVL